MMEFDVRTKRLDSQGSEAACKSVHITLDTDMQGRADAFNPAELLLAALSACIIKGIERIAPILNFSLNGVEVHVHGVRQDTPPKIASIQYEVIVDTDESGQRLELLHENIRKYGTVYNTIAPGTVLTGTVLRKEGACV
jgi:uncharacterized OsmC-like protein